MRTRLVLIATLLSLVAMSVFAQEPVTTDTAIKSPDPTFIVGAPAGKPLAGDELELWTQRTGSLLRCPVCQGLSVFDSPATMAVNMKHQVRDLHAKGYTRDQILEYFEKSYGEFVRLEPPLRGFNWLVWLAPLVALAAGGVIVWWMFRKPKTTDVAVAEQASTDAVRSIEIDPELEPYLRRVRELAYGPPASTRE